MSLAGEISTMRVVKLLDKKTLMIAGPGVEKVGVGSMIVILGIGKPIRELDGLPVVAPKALVEVTLHAGAYVIAQSPEIEEEVDPMASFNVLGTRKIRKRNQLNVDEKSLIGNPAISPIVEGDPAVPQMELKEYVTKLAQQLKWRE